MSAPASKTPSRETRFVGWARVYPALKRSVAKQLRRGAWYPVLRDEMPDRVTIRMGDRPVDVPRRLLEIRDRRPGFFTVVSRPEYRQGTGRPSEGRLGKTYVVCPSCNRRFALFGHPETKDCPGCGHRGDVAWWEA